ncbi:CRISPR-associated helicase Cas3' [Clostridioides difficile]|nr:CRISPR-associated helicase Cas3' [Clostridioides difficile]NJI80948.1 CRISPR-associated helicase Cas3' [Clostridioides difficile]
MNSLDKYKAKSDGISIDKHNEDMNYIMNQLVSIYNISYDMRNDLHEAIVCHDVGKVVKSFQDNIENTIRRVRHELLSASIKHLKRGQKLAILTHHKDIEYLVSQITNSIYEIELNELKEILDVEVEDIRPFIKEISRARNDDTRKLENILLKGYLQYCDHIASAGIKSIDKGFNSIKDFSLPKGVSYNSIQEKVLNMDKNEDIMIMAMTGLGKTATSLYWSDIAQNEGKSKRIYYILPYTASINSLYENLHNRNISVSMLHSKAPYFLNKISDEEDIKQLYQIYKKSVKQINVCTIFQLVKSIFSCKRFEMLLSQLKDSIFIVDEIHCFDTRVLCYTLEFLKYLKENLNVQICIMSASIPTCLKKLIQERLKISTIIEPDKNDLINRHKLNRINKSILDGLDKIENDMIQGKRVLICVNSVDLAQELYRKLQSYNPKLIHGRFNTRDREQAEEGIDKSFLLIGTQSIEVSLDISYDVLYTELAPFDSLLQRFGRVNRKGENKELSNVYIYDYDMNLNIYDYDIVNRTDIVISEIIHKDNSIVNESKVSFYLDNVYLDIDMDKYNKHKTNLEIIIRNMRVGVWNKSASIDMLNNDSISVIPESLIDEYKLFLNQKMYLEASSLFVNVSVKRYNSNRNMFYEDNDVIVTSYSYDNKLGLEFD